MSLEELETQWVQAKMEEYRQRNLRLSIETLMLQQIASPGEGTVRVTDTLRCKFGMTRSVDSEKLQAIWGDLTPEQQGAFKWKPEVTLTGLKKVPTEQMTKLAEVITTKPSKPSFELKD